MKPVKTATLTRRSTRVDAQFCKADAGRLETKDSIDVLEESSSNDPNIVFCTRDQTLQIEDTAKTNVRTVGDSFETHISRIDGPRSSAESHGHLDWGVAS